MLLWVVLLLCNMLTPVIVLLGGIFMQHQEHGEINYIMGYRTSRSTKSLEAYRFAQGYCGRIWKRLGVVLILITLITMLCCIRADEDTLSIVTFVLMAIQLVPMLLSIIPVERALKRNFG